MNLKEIHLLYKSEQLQQKLNMCSGILQSINTELLKLSMNNDLDIEDIREELKDLIDFMKED